MIFKIKKKQVNVCLKSQKRSVPLVVVKTGVVHLGTRNTWRRKAKLPKEKSAWFIWWGVCYQQLARWCIQLVIWLVVIGTLTPAFTKWYFVIFPRVNCRGERSHHQGLGSFRLFLSRASCWAQQHHDGTCGYTRKRKHDITVVRNKMKNACLHHTSDSALGFQTLSNIPAIQWLGIPSWHHVKSEGMCHALGFRRPWVTDHWEMLERQTSARERAAPASCSELTPLRLFFHFTVITNLTLCRSM